MDAIVLDLVLRYVDLDHLIEGAHMAGKSVRRVKQAAQELGLAIEVITMPESTRTAAEAAEACKCAVGQIMKSLIFAREDTGDLVLLLIAGDRLADMDLAADTIGANLTRADAKQVRQVTGFAIGGVAPIGHLADLAVYMDSHLMKHATVWAAAGAPNTIFAVDPVVLQSTIGAITLASPS